MDKQHPTATIILDPIAASTLQEEVDQLKQQQIGATPESKGLMPLADLSAQPLYVGSAHFLFNADGRPVDRPLVELSVQLRIAQALEQLTKPTAQWQQIGPFGHKVSLVTEADQKTVVLAMECPDADSAQIAVNALKTSLEPLFEQEGGQQNG